MKLRIILWLNGNIPLTDEIQNTPVINGDFTFTLWVEFVDIEFIGIQKEWAWIRLFILYYPSSGHWSRGTHFFFTSRGREYSKLKIFQILIIFGCFKFLLHFGSDAWKVVPFLFCEMYVDPKCNNFVIFWDLLCFGSQHTHTFHFEI